MPQKGKEFVLVENPDENEVADWLMFQYMYKQRAKSREYTKRIIENVSRHYVKKILKRNMGFNECDITNDLIEVKRTILKIKRKTRGNK
jgi:hypothetical protein